MTDNAEAADIAAPADGGKPTFLRSLWHPGIALALLDFVGLCIASYLSWVELRSESPSCGIIQGCETVANSEYSRIGGVPVAVFGVALSLTLMVLALGWWRTGRPGLLLAHYALSMVGVIFEMYFTYLQVFVIEAVCVWCAAYGISLLARFLLSLIVWLRRDEFTTPGRGDRAVS
ncbi:MAG TPA: vitamin K epoxide reductase family protein [Vicinamibacterales bacterium]